MNFDDYKVNLEYPYRPTKPSILRKSIDGLTGEEINNAIKIKQDWVKQCEAYETALEEYRNLQAVNRKRFERDLRDENGVKNDVLHARVYAYAYEQGHSEGLESFAYIYEDVIELVNDLVKDN